MREQLWYNMLDCKFQSYYLDELVTKYQLFERRLNIFLALTSSGSIASWAIWKQLDIIWAIIIAASAVATVVKPYFPFNKYVKEISKKANQLQNLHLDFEKLWFQFENNSKNSNDAFKELIDLKKRSVEILNFSDDTIITEQPKLEKKADESMRIYLRNNFNIQN